MHLLLDFGNTRLKYFIGEANTIHESGRFNKADLWVELQALQQKHPALSQAVASDVSGMLSSAAWNKHMQLPLLMVDAAKLQLPFSTRYTTLHTLGQDRVALLAGAQEHYPNTDLLLIDMGSCITYDLLTAKGEHLGGAISPGIAMRYNSLHLQTGKLPKLEFTETAPLLGTSTETAIHAGIIQGVIAEINAQIDHATKEYPNLTVILGGGDAQKLSKKIKKAIFAHPNLLALGLYKLWSFNLTA
jgi:type III pantothenate kinase